MQNEQPTIKNILTYKTDQLKKNQQPPLQNQQTSMQKQTITYAKPNIACNE